MFITEKFLLSEEKSSPKVIKVVHKKNYIVQDYKNPPKKQIKRDPETGELMYRRKKIIGKDGREHILTFAITKKEGKRGGHTKLTSKWDEKE